MFIILTGNPVEGFKAIGPFNTWDDAAEYGDRILAEETSDYWLMKVQEGGKGNDSQHYIYLSRPNDTIKSQPPLGPTRFGPFDEFVHLTDGQLRTGPDGDVFAHITAAGVWRTVNQDDPSETDPSHWYSDIVISSNKDDTGKVQEGEK